MRLHCISLPSKLCPNLASYNAGGQDHFRERSLSQMSCSQFKWDTFESVSAGDDNTPPVIWSLRLTRPNWRGATFILSCHRQLHPVTTISSPGIASNAKSQPSLGCWEILPFHEGPNTLEQMASEIMADEVQKELVRHHGDPPQIPFPLIHQFLWGPIRETWVKPWLDTSPTPSPLEK